MRLRNLVVVASIGFAGALVAPRASLRRQKRSLVVVGGGAAAAGDGDGAVTHSILEAGAPSAHLGDVGGTDLAADLALARGPISFSPLERIVLTANGNLQRILASYHDAPVAVEVLAHERVRLGLWRRRVRLAVAGRVACVASSTVTARTRRAIELADGGAPIGQLFAELGGRRAFALLEVGRTAAAFSRTYTLSNAHLVCHIEEVLPATVFDADFVTRDAAAWHPDAA